ncbi:hypothetical protein SASPL_125348 [Salvia splendens]|uniref:S-acyltransferase n=1 Tax=Salvia splendens TaxID=180675 RepID=A0A8X8ZQN8_SALSN|nr:hypothetical protein SASPL_125348 [Salvia splendens]
MYVVPPPKGSDKVGGSETGSDEVRIYQAWKGSNGLSSIKHFVAHSRYFVFVEGLIITFFLLQKFFLQGRLIFGPDVRSLALTIFLIVAPVSVFCVFVAHKLMNDSYANWGGYIMAIAIVLTSCDLMLLLLTSGRDPGIIPRNAHPPEPEACDDNTGGTQTPQLRLPRVKEVEVNGMTVKIKYCDTCMLYRPPRCSHCSICNNCVERFDHHCPWVGQCIGLVRYAHYLKHKYFCLFEMLGGITNLTSLNDLQYTTYENFRYRYDRRANPYNKGLLVNFKETLCNSIPPSRNNFRAKVPREVALPVRSVTGGFNSPNMGKAVDDIEMGRKGVWGDIGSVLDQHEGQFSDNGGLNYKSSGLGEMSPEISTVKEGDGGRGGMHSSWGRKAGNWERSPEILALASRMAVGSGSGGGTTLSTEL